MSDQDMLRQQVLDELNWEPHLDATGIRVAVTDEVVMLGGVVATYADKVAAERLAKRAGGRAVVNDLDVKLRAVHERDDTAIAEAALQALRANARLDAERLRVRVADGWVRLEGTVDQPYQRSAAEEVLQTVTGVVGVTNLVAIEPATPASQTDVKSVVEAALRRRAELAAYDATQVRVEAHGDRVVLRGTVHSWADRAAAEAAAWGAPGILAVEDELQVVPPPDA